MASVRPGVSPRGPARESPSAPSRRPRRGTRHPPSVEWRARSPPTAVQSGRAASRKLRALNRHRHKAKVPEQATVKTGSGIGALAVGELGPT